MITSSSSDPGTPEAPRLARFVHRFGERPDEQALEEGWRRALGAVARDGFEIVQEKVYGTLALHAPAVQARRRVYGRERADELPWSFAGIRSCPGGDALALEIVAIGGAVAPVRTIRHAGRAVGRCFDDGVARGLFLADLAAGERRAASATVAREGLERAFRTAFDVAAAERFGAADLARTWIYLDPLLEHYDSLNQARNALFEELGLHGGPDGLPPPASTGIQGAHASGAPGFLDLAFFAPSTPAASHPLEPIGAAEQCEAWSYGSAFSRAVRVVLAAEVLVYVSGTASIGADGRTLHVGDPARQLLHAFEVVRGVLERAGAGFEHVVSGALFLKDPEAHAAWRQLRSEGRLPELPVFAVQADVCRDDLLVELEVTARAPR